MGFYVKSIYLNRKLLKSKIYTNISNINVGIEKKKYIKIPNLYYNVQW